MAKYNVMRVFLQYIIMVILMALMVLMTLAITILFVFCVGGLVTQIMDGLGFVAIK